MANRHFEQNMWSMVKEPVLLEGSVTIGNAGAVSSYTGTGISSVALVAESTGKYLITLEDGYARFFNFKWVVESATFSTVAFVEIVPTATTSQADILNSKVQVQCYDKTGAAVNPASGAVIHFSMFLRHSSVKGKGE